MTAPLRPAERAALERACDLARNARGMVSPNPLVGAIVLRGEQMIGEGWHEGPGTPHAEVMALRAAPETAGTTVVCNLEPCSHHGRTPPCSEALIAAAVARVVIGALDPLERERAQGVEVLRGAGIEVVVADDPGAARCRELNAPFYTWARTGRPLVTLKMATSLDGRIATASGQSRWITGPAARAAVHEMRAASDAVAVGSGTALADDPSLTARDVDGPVRQPTRVVVDSRARLPVGSSLARGAPTPPVLLFGSPDAPAAAVAALEAAGVEVISIEQRGPERYGEILAELGRREIQSLLVEGGAGLAGALLDAELVDRVVWMQAPMLIGGEGAPAAVAGSGIGDLDRPWRLHGVTVERLGDDICVSGSLRAPQEAV